MDMIYWTGSRGKVGLWARSMDKYRTRRTQNSGSSRIWVFSNTDQMSVTLRNWGLLWDLNLGDGIYAFKD